MTIECFWLGKQKENLAHIIANSRIEETEAGTEGDVYTAYCGEIINSWSSQRIQESRFGSFKDIEKQGILLCQKCLYEYGGEG